LLNINTLKIFFKIYPPIIASNLKFRSDDVYDRKLKNDKERLLYLFVTIFISKCLILDIIYNMWRIVNNYIFEITSIK